MKENQKRIFALDELRGFAIIAMVVHHIFLDVGYVFDSQKAYDIFDFLCNFQPLFWGIFIVISGICSQLSRNSVKRGSIVFGGAIVITFATAVIMPLINMDGLQIYFGVLHMLGISMIVAGLLKKPINKSNSAVFSILMLFLFVITYNISSGYLAFFIKMPSVLYETNYLMPFGFYNSSFFSADYFPLFPWIFMFLFGAFLGKYAKDGKFPKTLYKRRSKFLCFVGKNALWIYLLHQVVIYAVLYIISFIMLIFC